MTILTQRIDDLIKGKSEKGKSDKGKGDKGLVAKSFDWDDESVSSDDEGITKFKAFMAIVEDEPYVGKRDARSGQWVKITMKKVHKLLSITDGEERKHVLDYTHVDLHYLEDQRKDLVNKFNALKQDLSFHNKVTLDQLLFKQIPGNIVKALGGKGRRKENSKADVSTSESALIITFDSEDDSDIQEPLPPLPKLTGADPSDTSKSVISLFDLTANMADLTLNTASKEIKKSSNKVSQTYVIKKRTESKHPVVQNSCPNKNALPSTEQLLLTLMEEVKGLKKQILIPSDTSSSVSQACSSKTPNQKDYLKRSVWYLDSGCSRHMTGAKQYLHRYSKEPGVKTSPSYLLWIKRYGPVNVTKILQHHLTKDKLSQTDCNITLTKLKTKFENAFNSEFKERKQKYTRFNAQSFQDAMICNMDSIGKYMLEIILHQQRDSAFRHLLQAHMGNVKKSIAERTCHQRQYDRRVNKRQMQMQESKIDTSKAVDADLVVTKSSGTESEVQDDSSRPENHTDADDADIRHIYDDRANWLRGGFPTGKILASCRSKDNNESTHGSNVDIPNIHKCKQTLDLSAADLIVMTSMIEFGSLFSPLFDEYFYGENQVVSKCSAVTTADASDTDGNNRPDLFVSFYFNSVRTSVTC
ncbi:hypothetical protein Tco_0708026 [Tanacetum coccineum]